MRAELESTQAAESEQARGELESMRGALESARGALESARGELSSARGGADAKLAAMRAELESARVATSKRQDELSRVRHALAAANAQLRFKIKSRTSIVQQRMAPLIAAASERERAATAREREAKSACAEAASAAASAVAAVTARLEQRVRSSKALARQQRRSLSQCEREVSSREALVLRLDELDSLDLMVDELTEERDALRANAAINAADAAKLRAIFGRLPRLAPTTVRGAPRAYSSYDHRLFLALIAQGASGPQTVSIARIAVTHIFGADAKEGVDWDLPRADKLNKLRPALGTIATTVGAAYLAGCE